MSAEQVTREELSARELGQKLVYQVAGKPMHQSTLRELQTTCNDHVAAARRTGIRMPDLVVLPFVKAGNVQAVPREITDEGMQNAVLNWFEFIPNLTPQEVAFALNWGFRGRRFPNLVIKSRKEMMRGA